MLILGMDLVVKNLDDVSHGDDAHELLVAQDGNLGDMTLAHLSHDIVDVVLERARDRPVVMTSAIRSRPNPSPRLWIKRSTSRSLKTPPGSVRVDHRKRPNVILHQLGDGFADGRLAINGYDAAAFGFKDISNQHEAPPGYRTGERSHRPESPPTDALELSVRRET